MKLSAKAKRNFRKTKHLYRDVATTLNMTEGNVRRLVSDNEDNNALTKIAAINTISKHTGLGLSQIVTDK